MPAGTSAPPPPGADAVRREGAASASAAAPRGAPGLLARASRLRRASAVADDFLWARATRPFAALALAALNRVPLTPNALSLAGLFVGLVSALGFAVLPGAVGLLAAWGLGQLAFVIDCMDGMLARAAGLRSRCGTALDFLVDALKQMALFPAIGWRVWVEAGRPTDGLQAWPLGAAIVAGPLVAAALAVTTFLRSPEVTGSAVRARRAPHDRSLRGRALAALAFLMNYPSWILLPVLARRMDLFLAISLPLYALHLLQGLLAVARRVGGWQHYRDASPESTAAQRAATRGRS